MVFALYNCSRCAMLTRPAKVPRKEMRRTSAGESRTDHVGDFLTKLLPGSFAFDPVDGVLHKGRSVCKVQLGLDACAV